MEKPNHVDAIIIGRGIAGLTLALRGFDRGRRVLLLERSSRVGGALHSEERAGFRLEHGANTVLPKPELVELIDRIGLRSHMRLGDAKAPRYILYDGRLWPVPTGPLSLARSGLLSPAGRLRVFAEPFIPRRTGGADDETLMEFARRRLGTEAAERLLAPFVSGVWAGDADRLSARAAFPDLIEWERQHGSLFGGAIAKMRGARKDARPRLRGLIQFHDGLEELPRTIAARLGPAVRTGVVVKEIRPNAAGPWEVRTPTSALAADQVILAAPAFEIAPLVRPFDAPAADALESIPYAPLVVLHLGFRRSDVRALPPGFGYLAAPNQGHRLLGCLWNSNLFPDTAPPGHALFTLFIGGARYPSALARSDGDLLSDALADLTPLLGIVGPPVFVSFTRIAKAIPQYTIGHDTRAAAIRGLEQRWSGLHVAGNMRNGISVSDVVASSVKFAAEIFQADPSVRPAIGRN